MNTITRGTNTTITIINGPIWLRFLGLAVLAVCLGRAQDSPAFEAAAVKPAPAGSRPYPRLDIEPGRLQARAATLRYLISEAYGLEDQLVTGTSGWMDSDVFTIMANTAAPTDRAGMMAMLRTLLEDRFQLKSHRENRDLAIFALTVAKGGSKLQPLKEGETDTPPGNLSSTERITLRVGSTVPELVRFLNSRTGAAAVGRLVVDRTGIQGKYKIWLAFDNAMDPEGHGGRLDLDYSSALPQQLGLRLQPERVPVSVLVLERANRPAAE